MLMNRLAFVFIFILHASSAHAGVCNADREMNSAQNLLIENICHFKNTVLVEIKSDYLRGWYNPVTHFSIPNTFEYEVQLIEVIKGRAPTTTCMFESTEATFVIMAGISNQRHIVSFDEHASCVLIDVGTRLEATPELMKIARKTTNHEFESE